MNSVLSPTEETHLLDIPIPVSNILSLPSPKCKEENYTKEQDMTIFHKKREDAMPSLTANHIIIPATPLPHH